ncbi:hypothetical protein Tco_0486503 [Tanacetum coccineum]
MNPQETQQVVARDEKWVPFTGRVKISSTNVRLETTVPQKEETFQVVIDLIKNSKCFKAFTISADVLKIFMQQFWYSIKKVQGTSSYEFLLANKKFMVNADVFRTILEICPRVKGINFTDVPDDDTTLTFLIKLGYKGPLYKHTNMFVDHMHQPQRTLAAIINKCLSKKTASNDKLCKSRIDILWGMFYRENVGYRELIWKDLAYQIDHWKETRSRRENMSFPRFTKVMINHFLKQYNSLSNLKYQHYHIIKDDDYADKSKKPSESYQMFIKYSTGQISPKKSRGKGSQRKKTADDSQETVDVYEESEPEPEPVKRKTSSKGRVKKKVTLSADDNIIFDDPDIALKLGKSISKTEAEEAEAARQVHATHARIVTESVPEPTKRRKSGKLTSDPPKKLKGTRGSSEGIVTIPGVPDESTIISATSSEGTGTKPGVSDEENDITEENVILEWGSEQESEYSEEDKLDDEEKDDKEGDADDEDDETKYDEDDIYKYKIRVRKDEDEEMLNAKVEDSDKGDEEVTDAAKADAEKTSKVKDDAKKTELPLTSSSLYVSSGFGDQFLQLSSGSSLMSTVKDTTDAEINSLLELRVAKLEKDVSKLKKIDLSTEALAALKTQVPSIVDNYLGSKVGDTPTTDLEQESEKTPLEILKIKKKQAEKQKMSKFTIKSTDKASLKENPANHRLYHALMEALIEDENAMDKEVADTVQDHKRKHNDDEDPPDGPNQGKKTKRRRTKDSESSKKPSITKETPKGKAPSKGSKTGKSASAKEPVEEPIAEVVMDDVGDSVVHDDDQLQDTSEPKIQIGSRNL